MKCLGLILVVVVALMSGQVIAKGINEKDSRSELKSALLHHCSSTAESLARSALGEKLRKFVENLRFILREGNATLNIPVLDPFASDNLAVELEEDLLKGTIEASNFYVTGLSGYKVDQADFVGLKITLGLTWPLIYSKGSYKLDIEALENIKAWGNGEYTVSLNDLSFTTTVKMGILGGVSIKSMETEIFLGNLALSATGLFNDESTAKIVSEVISEMAPELLQDYQVQLTTAINENVMILVNQYLEGKSLKDIIAILG